MNITSSIHLCWVSSYLEYVATIYVLFCKRCNRYIFCLSMYNKCIQHMYVNWCMVTHFKHVWILIHVKGLFTLQGVFLFPPEEKKSAKVKCNKYNLSQFCYKFNKTNRSQKNRDSIRILVCKLGQLTNAKKLTNPIGLVIC